MSTRTLAATLTLIIATATGTTSVLSQGTATSSRPLVTKAEYERWQTELSNWGRWGKDDEMGTLNLVTPAKRKQAAALVREGVTVSLASNAADGSDLVNSVAVAQGDLVDVIVTKAASTGAGPTDIVASHEFA